MRPALLTGRASRYLFKLRTEGMTRPRQAAAVGLGLFIGCTPFYGGHFWICIAVGWLLGLNRLTLYLAANVSNPLLAPFLVFAEIQSGSLLRRGSFYPLSVDAVRSLDAWGFAADLLLGSAAVGAMLGVGAGLATWVALGRNRLDERDEEVIAAAAATYLSCGVPAWEVANGKLRGDRVYREVLRDVPLPRSGRIVDLGCGRGLMLAVLAAERDLAPAGHAPAWDLIGLEYRSRIVRIGRRALAGKAVIEEADLSACELPACRVALLFDVLHLLPEETQASLLERLRGAVEPGGLLVVREADAAGGWRFHVGQGLNRMMALVQGRWGRRFHFRSAAGWAEFLRQSGFEVLGEPRPARTVYRNVVLCARRTDLTAASGPDAVR